MKLGEQLKQLRLEKGYTQEELANKLFVTRQTISNWETEKGQPDIENIVLLAQTFDISIDELMTGKRLIISEKNAIGKKHFIALIIWSIVLLALQMIIRPATLILLLIYAIGGLIISVHFMYKTKRLPSLYGQAENMYDWGLYLCIFYFFACIAVVVLQISRG